MSESSSVKVRRIIRLLAKKYGKIPWWPGNTDEVMIGAILTQQTRWENVELALAGLKRKQLGSLSAIHSAKVKDVEQAIRCTGFYRVKAKRLISLSRYVMETYGNVSAMENFPTEYLRAGLLGVNGIGEETADSILCYGFSRTSFVIDSYTERIMQCMNIRERRTALKNLFEYVLPGKNSVYRQTHAHIVEYGKEFCGKKRCDECILVSLKG
jgi:endonuclease-3 related protein